MKLFALSPTLRTLTGKYLHECEGRARNREKQIAVNHLTLIISSFLGMLRFETGFTFTLTDLSYLYAILQIYHNYTTTQLHNCNYETGVALGEGQRDTASS